MIEVHVINGDLSEPEIDAYIAYGREKYPDKEICGVDIRLDGEFVRWIWEFHRTQRPQVLELLDGWTGEKHVFRSPKDCARFLAKLEREGQAWRKF